MCQRGMCLLKDQAATLDTNGVCADMFPRAAALSSSMASWCCIVVGSILICA